MHLDQDAILALGQGAKLITLESFGEAGYRGAYVPELPPGVVFAFNPAQGVPPDGSSLVPCIHARVLVHGEDRKHYAMAYVEGSEENLILYQAPTISDAQKKDASDVHDVVDLNTQIECLSRNNAIGAVVSYYSRYAPTRVYMFRLDHLVHSSLFQNEDEEPGIFTPIVAPVHFTENTGSTFETTGYRFHIAFELPVLADQLEVNIREEKKGKTDEEKFLEMQAKLKTKKEARKG